MKISNFWKAPTEKPRQACSCPQLVIDPDCPTHGYAYPAPKIPLRFRFWVIETWFHRCPECGHRPDKHYGPGPCPRWEDDRIAAVLGIGKYGCRRCGHGAIEGRDTAKAAGR